MHHNIHPTLFLRLLKRITNGWNIDDENLKQLMDDIKSLNPSFECNDSNFSTLLFYYERIDKTKYKVVVDFCSEKLVEKFLQDVQCFVKKNTFCSQTLRDLTEKGTRLATLGLTHINEASKQHIRSFIQQFNVNPSHEFFELYQRYADLYKVLVAMDKQGSTVH